MPLIKRIFGILLFVLVSSCGTPALFEKNIQFESSKWSYEDVAQFEFTIDKPEDQYRIILFLRHTNDYPYSNIHLNTRTTFPKSPVVEDIVEVQLAKKNGDWLGSGSGHIINRKIILSDQFRFPDMGQYRIDISQHMREDPLEHILDIGLRLEKIDNE